MSQILKEKYWKVFSKSRILSTLFFLLFVSVLLPATVQYSVAFWILIFFVVEYKSKGNRLKNQVFNFLTLRNISELQSLFLLYSLSFVILIFPLLWITLVSNDFPWALDQAKEFRKFIHFLLKYFCFPLICFCMVWIGSRFGFRFQRFGKAFVIWYGIYFAYCLLQRNFGFDWIRGFSSTLLEQRLMYGDVYRLNGFMSHPLSFSYNLLLLFLLSLGMLFRGVDNKDEFYELSGRKFDSWGVLAIIFGIMIFISGSRLPALLAVFSAAVMVLFNPSVKGIYKYLILSLILLFFGLNQSLTQRILELMRDGGSFLESESRFKFWEIHWDIFNDYVWTGTGLSSAEAARLYYFKREGYTGLYEGYNAHNILLQNLADFGLWGFLSFLGLFGSYAYALRLCLPKFPKYYLGLWFLVIFVGGMFQNHLRDSEFNFALVLCFAVLYSVSKNVDYSSQKVSFIDDPRSYRQSVANRKSLED